MLYLVFCLTDGKFRDIRDEFDFQTEKQFVGYQSSNVFLKEEVPEAFWENQSSLQMKLLLTMKGETWLLEPERILYLEITGRILRAHLEDSDEVCETYAQLKDVEGVLEKIGFIRISRFFIVSIRHITAIQGGEVRLSSGKRLRIGRAFKQKLKVVLVKNSIH